MQRVALLRRTGIVPDEIPRYGPGSAAHHAVKNGALRCVQARRLEAGRPPSYLSVQSNEMLDPEWNTIVGGW
jgi:hypothetical protein